MVALAVLPSVMDDHASVELWMVPMSHEQLKVCLVAHTFAPFSRGGVETYVMDLAHGLLAAGESVVVFHPFDDRSRADWLLEEVVVEGVDVVRLNRHGWAQNQEFGDERLDRLFAQLLHDHGVHVVHVHHLARALSPTMLSAAYLSGVRVVLTMHDSWMACAKANPVRWDGSRCGGPVSAELCARCLSGGIEPAAGMTDYVIGRNDVMAEALQWCDLITAPSHYQARFVESAPWHNGVIQRRPTGITLSARKRAADGPERVDAPTGPRPLRLVALGNFVRQDNGTDVKGVGVLAAAGVLLCDEMAEIHVHGQVDDAALAAFAESPNIIVRGPFTAEDREAIFEGADALVMSSLIENYPTVAREAFDHGVPVIATDVGGVAEIVTHGVDGLIVPSGDAHALAGAIERVARDRDLLHRLASKVRPPLSIADDAAAWVATYHELVGPLAPPDGDQRISVVIATYNRQRELRVCLEALCRQSLPPSRFEVIVVDDASRDLASTVTDEFSDRLDVQVVRHEQNRGLGEARNTGLDLASTAITLFLDDDDVAGPRLLAEHLRAHIECPSDAVAVLGFTGVVPELLGSNLLRHVMMIGQQYLSYPALREGHPLPWHCGWGGRTSYKTRLVRRVRFASRWMEDTEMNWRLRHEGLDVRLRRSATQFITEATDLDAFLRRTRNLGATAADLADADPSGLGSFLAVDHAKQQLPEAEGRAGGLEVAVRQLIDVPRSTLCSQRVDVGDGRVSYARLLDHGLLMLLEAERLRGVVIRQAVRSHPPAVPFAMVCVAAPSTIAAIGEWLSVYASAFAMSDPVTLVVLIDALENDPTRVLGTLEETARQLGLDLDAMADVAVTPVVEDPWPVLAGSLWWPVQGATTPSGLISIGARPNRDQFRQAIGLPPLGLDLRQSDQAGTVGVTASR